MSVQRLLHTRFCNCAICSMSSSRNQKNSCMFLTSICRHSVTQPMLDCDRGSIFSHTVFSLVSYQDVVGRKQRLSDYTRFVLLLKCREWSAASFSAFLRRGHTATLAVCAALVESQWQHRAWTVSLHPPTPTVKMDPTTVFQAFGMTQSTEIRI